MKNTFVVAAGALALAIVAGPMVVPQAHAARRAHTIKRAAPAPKKDPACNIKLQKDSMAWMEYHHCYGSR